MERNNNLTQTSKQQVSERSHSSYLKTDKPELDSKLNRVRCIVGIASGFLVGANAGVQLWHNLNLGDRLPWIEKPPAIEQVKPQNPTKK